MMSLTLNSPKGIFVWYDAIVVLLAIFANCLVLIAILRGRFSHQKLFYRYFLISLAACDLYASAVNVAAMAYQLHPSSSQADGVTTGASFFIKCGANVLRTLQLCGFFTNLANLSAMSIDHFFSVFFPAKYRNLMSDYVARLTIISIWICSFCLACLDIPINILIYQTMSTNVPQHHDLYDLDGPSFATPAQHPSPLQGSTANYDEAATHDAATVDDDDVINSHPIRKLLDDIDYRQATDYDEDSMKTMSTAMSGYRSNNDSAVVLSKFFNMLQNDDQDLSNSNACTFFSVKKMWFELFIIALVLACFILLTVCYSAIFRRIEKRFDNLMNHRHHQHHHHHHHHHHASDESNDSNHMSHSHHFIRTTVIFIVAFAVCWLPFMLFEFVMFIIFHTQRQEHSEDINFENGSIRNLLIIQAIFNSLMETHQLLDPIIYATRIPAVSTFITSLICCPGLKDLLKKRGQMSQSSSMMSMTNQTVESTNLLGIGLRRLSSFGRTLRRTLRQQRSTASSQQTDLDQNGQFANSFNLSTTATTPSTTGMLSHYGSTPVVEENGISAAESTSLASHSFLLAASSQRASDDDAPN